MGEVIYLNTFASPPTMNPISNQTLRMNIHFEVCRGGVVCENLPNSDVFLEISYTWSTERPTDSCKTFKGGIKISTSTDKYSNSNLSFVVKVQTKPR